MPTKTGSWLPRSRNGSKRRRRTWRLVEGLKHRTPMNELENQFRGKTLGKAREKLISAYSRFLLAENLSKSAETVGRNVLRPSR